MNYPDKIELILTYKHDPEDTEIFTEKVDAVKMGDYYKWYMFLLLRQILPMVIL